MSFMNECVMCTKFRYNNIPTSESKNGSTPAQPLSLSAGAHDPTLSEYTYIPIAMCVVYYSLAGHSGQYTFQLW